MRDPLALGAAFDPRQRALTVLGALDVAAAVQGHERELIHVVELALAARSRGEVEMPLTEALRVPGRDPARLTARGVCIAGAQAVAGVHWRAAFPANRANGLPSGSGLIVLNRPDSGRPATVIEASVIGGQRTAALAALAARVLHPRARIGTLGILGCGLAGREIARFILADERPVEAVLVHDGQPAYSRSLADALRAEGRLAAVGVARSRKEMVERCDLLVFAGAAPRPSLDSIARSPRDATILHVSLRDLTANALLQADNVCDDLPSLLASSGTVKRAAQLTGRDDIVRTTLGEVLTGRAPARRGDRPVVFHPADGALLDVAIARFVAERCADSGVGVVVPGFLA